MQKFNSVNDLVNTIRPVDTIYCIRTASVKTACDWFKWNLPGNIIYAVKTNQNEKLTKCIGDSRISKLNVASIHEFTLIKEIIH